MLAEAGGGAWRSGGWGWQGTGLPGGRGCAVRAAPPFTARLGAAEATLRVRTSPTVREGVLMQPAI